MSLESPSRIPPHVKAAIDELDDTRGRFTDYLVQNIGNEVRRTPEFADAQFRQSAFEEINTSAAVVSGSCAERCRVTRFG